jgi:hypothetical protein
MRDTERYSERERGGEREREIEIEGKREELVPTRGKAVDGNRSCS